MAYFNEADSEKNGCNKLVIRNAELRMERDLLRRERQEIMRLWSEYTWFMRGKYGEDFEWTCPWLRAIDDALREERND